MVKWRFYNFFVVDFYGAINGIVVIFFGSCIKIFLSKLQSTLCFRGKCVLEFFYFVFAMFTTDFLGYLMKKIKDGDFA